MLWACVSFAWLMALTIHAGSEIQRLDDDDDRKAGKTLDALRAAVKVLEDDE